MCNQEFFPSTIGHYSWLYIQWPTKGSFTRMCSSSYQCGSGSEKLRQKRTVYSSHRQLPEQAHIPTTRIQKMDLLNACHTQLYDF
jgi:hypothetical protein